MDGGDPTADLASDGPARLMAPPGLGSGNPFYDCDGLMARAAESMQADDAEAPVAPGWDGNGSPVG